MKLGIVTDEIHANLPFALGAAAVLMATGLMAPVILPAPGRRPHLVEFRLGGSGVGGRG